MEDFWNFLDYFGAMLRGPLILICLLIMVSHQNNRTFYRPTFKFKLSKGIKRSFTHKKSFYLYRSLITGQKRGVRKTTKEALKTFNLLHLLTPSGLHFSSLLMLLVLFRRKFQLHFIDLFEMGLCLGVYIFLPGYFSLRRVAFLRFLFLTNKKLKQPIPKDRLFLFFFIFDFIFGTYSLGPLSFSYSMLFLTIIFLTKKVSFIKLIPLFFLGQMVTAYSSNQVIDISTLLVSPLFTWTFSLIYPLLFINLFFIESLNYSEFIMKSFEQALAFFSSGVSGFYLFKPNLIMILGIIILGSRTIYLSLALFIIGLVANQ